MHRRNKKIMLQAKAKEQILKIADDLRDGVISTDDALRLLFRLFGFSNNAYNQIYEQMSNVLSTEFNLHQHWREEPKAIDDEHSGTIKHFQD
jgi:hypothetical protein